MPEFASPSSRDLPLDISSGAILGSAAAILIAVALSVLGAHVLLDVYGMRTVNQNAEPDMQIRGARLQSAPQRDKGRYLAQKRGWLESWGWVDRQAGTVHIPIEKAMQQLSAERKKGAQR